MNVPSRGPKRDDRLEVLWEDGERVFCREQRLKADGKLSNVLIVMLSAEHPTRRQPRSARARIRVEG